MPKLRRMKRYKNIEYGTIIELVQQSNKTIKYKILEDNSKVLGKTENWKDKVFSMQMNEFRFYQEVK